MTKDELIFKIETQVPFEFTYKGKVYNMTYDKAADGSILIRFGRLYEQETYDSFGQLMNNARIENHFFKDMLDII
ncbi:MAG: hypothetical protein K5681_00345 [Treponema sp.]|nr:hypothetical protein [Treponema sp.]